MVRGSLLLGDDGQGFLSVDTDCSPCIAIHPLLFVSVFFLSVQVGFVQRKLSDASLAATCETRFLQGARITLVTVERIGEIVKVFRETAMNAKKIPKIVSDSLEILHPPSQ